MSQAKRCIFVAERSCPFQTAHVPFQTCQLCIEAWKTDVAQRSQKVQEAQINSEPIQPLQNKLRLPTVENNHSVFYDNKLKEIDELLKNDDIDPMEYIQLRKQRVNNLVDDTKHVLRIEKIDEPVEKIPPAPRETRVAVIIKSMFGSQTYTSPNEWKLPREISGKVIDSIFKMAKKKHPEDIKLRAGNYKIACIAVEKNKLALMVLDADEEFETYDNEIDRIYEVLSKEKFWANAVKKIQND
jgi:hypothetical protein